MTDHLSDAYAATGRLETLLAQLDQSARPGDLTQTLGGLAVEARLVRHHLAALCQARQEAATAVVADSPGLTRINAPATSRAAARQVRTGTARAQVLWALLHTGPRTDLELQEELRMPANTERPRRVELVDMGLVTATEQTRVHNGMEWTVWSLTRMGEGVAEGLDQGKDWEYVAEIPAAAASTPDTDWGNGTLF